MKFYKRREFIIGLIVLYIIIFLSLVGYIVYDLFFKGGDLVEVFRVYKYADKKSKIKFAVIYMDDDKTKKRISRMFIGTNNIVNRKNYGKLLNMLNKIKLKGIYFDLRFIPNDFNFTEKGKYFAEAMKRSKNRVYIGCFLSGFPEERNDPLKLIKLKYLDKIELKNVEHKRSLYEIDLEYFTLPPMPFLTNAFNIGSRIPDEYKNSSGVWIFNKMRMITKIKDKVYPNVLLMMMKDLYNVELNDIYVKVGKYIKLGNKGYIPIDREGMMEVKFAPDDIRNKYCNEYSLIDVLNGKVDINDFKDRYVIIGSKDINSFIPILNHSLNYTLINVEVLKNMDIYLNMSTNEIKPILDSKEYDLYDREEYQLR